MESRITPACAGKTSAISFLLLSRKDHPRLRRENADFDFSIFKFVGSPPLAQGKLKRIPYSARSSGITPACAGKTHQDNIFLLLIWDHPRLRRENNRELEGKPPLRGSPPLAQGKPIPPFANISHAGITPACAGKTHRYCRGRASDRDHPRLRRENLKRIPYLQPFLNLYL